MAQDAVSAAAPAGVGKGSRIAGYLLMEQIGQGGMAVVFRAHDERLDRTVALKVLAPALAADESFRQRFIRESRAAAAVDDPHIIPVFEAGDSGGVLFIAMRFVRGGDVRTLVTELGRLQPARAAEIVSQVASALDAAHRRGLVHRDVKPANMLLDAATDREDRPDHVYLSDFGLSKASLHATGITGTGTFLGTLDYVSPEQIEGKLVDGRADQYSLACAAFELLSGQPPFRRSEPMAVMYAQLHQPPASLADPSHGVTAEVDRVFARALAKAPADRYSSCCEFAAALRRALGLSAGGMRPAAAAGGGLRPPAELVRQADATADTVAPPPAAAWTAGPRTAEPAMGTGPGAPDPYRGQPARRSRQPTAALLLVAACILIAAGVVAGAIMLRPQRPAAAGTAAGQQTPGQGGRSTPGASPSASRAGTRVHRSPHARLPLQSGYSPVATLGPGPSSRGISSVSWSPDGTLIAASDKNGRTYLWNAGSGTSHGQPLPGPPAAYSTAFSPKGTILATGYSNGSTYLWNVTTRRRTAVLHDPGQGSGREVDSVAFSQDGSTLVTSDGNGYANLWHVTSSGRATRLASLADPAGAGVYSAAFGASGTLATGDYAGHVYLWDTSAGTTTASFVIPGPACYNSICDAISALAFSGDGGLLAAGTESGTAELWNVARGQGSEFGAPGGSPAIWALSFGTPGTLAMACANGDSYIWRADAAALTAALTGTIPDPHSGGKGVGTLAFSGNGQYLVTGDTNGTAYLWKAG